MSEVKAEKATKATTVSKVGTNYLALPFPVDPHGTCKALRDGGVATVLRIRGDKEKHERFLATIRVLVQFAQERMDAESK